jgi:PXPV repeat (3 copies)
MKNSLTIAAGLIASAALMMAASPAMAHVDVGVNIGIPGVFAAPVYVVPQPVYVEPQPVYVQPRPVYIEREREREWHERHYHEDRHDERRGHDRGEHRGHDD